MVVEVSRNNGGGVAGKYGSRSNKCAMMKLLEIEPCEASKGTEDFDDLNLTHYFPITLYYRTRTTNIYLIQSL